MSRLPDGLSPFRGFVVGLLGAVLWIMVSVVAGTIGGLGGEVPGLIDSLVTVTFLIMIAGPGWYWVGRPAYVWVRNRGGESE